MGKSSKKSTPKVDAAPAVVRPIKSAKKGKREAEEVIVKQSAEKQKLDVGLGQAVQKQKSEAKTQKRKMTKSDSEDSSSSDSDQEQKKPVTKVSAAAKKPGVTPKKTESSESSSESDSSDYEGTNNGAVPDASKAQPSKKRDEGESSESDSDKDDDGSSESYSHEDVDAAPAVVPPIKSAKKGKREAKELMEKVNAKKQKIDARLKQAVQKQKSEVKTQKTMMMKKDYEDSSSSDSDQERKKPVAKISAGAKKPGATLKKTESSESSLESDSPDDEVTTNGVIPAASRVQPSKKRDESEILGNDSDEDDDGSSESDSDEDSLQALSKTPPISPTLQMGKSSKKSTSQTPAVVPPIKSAKKGKREADEVIKKQSVKKQKIDVGLKQSLQNQKSEVKAQKNKMTKKDAEDSSSSDSDQELKKPVAKISDGAKKPGVTPEEMESSESSSEGDSSDDEGIANGAVPAASKVQPSKKTDESESSESDSDADDDGSSESDSDEDNNDVEMVDAVSPKTDTKQADSKFGKKAPKTPATPQTQASGSKTLFVGNLHFDIDQADVENFFKDAGEIVDVRFSSSAEGVFKGFGHIEFATVEAAQKALELNGKDLLGRAVRLDIARERGSFTPYGSKESNSYQKGGRGQGQTVYIRGFDASIGVDKIESALQKHFGSCGELSRVAIPKDHETGNVKGFAYIDFNDAESFKKALELSGSELGGYPLTVEEAKPKGDNRDSSGRGRGGGRSGGRDGGGRFGGRRGGGRGGGAGRSGGGRGRGAPNKASIGATSTGKKTTFDD